jgi:phosphoribosylformylglycinamidine synthase
MARKVRVFVTLKRGVLDPQGAAVSRALHAMGYGEVEDVRLGKLVELTVKEGEAEAEARRRLDEMCRRLLANTVIEEYAFAEAAPEPTPAVKPA